LRIFQIFEGGARQSLDKSFAGKATFQFILPQWRPDASELPQANSARSAN